MNSVDAVKRVGQKISGRPLNRLRALRVGRRLRFKQGIVVSVNLPSLVSGFPRPSGNCGLESLVASTVTAALNSVAKSRNAQITVTGA